MPFVCLSADYREDFTVPAEVDLIGRFDHLDVDFPFRRKADVTTVVNGAALP